MKNKKCFKCKKIKPLNMFYKHGEMADGHLNKCKRCSKKDTSSNYIKNKEYYREYERERNKLQPRKEKKRLYSIKRKRLHPIKYKSNKKTSNAIRDGKLHKKPCEVCGETNSQAHHKDYRKWDDIMWLCFKHHRELHGQKVS